LSHRPKARGILDARFRGHDKCDSFIFGRLLTAPPLPRAAGSPDRRRKRWGPVPLGVRAGEEFHRGGIDRYAIQAHSPLGVLPEKTFADRNFTLAEGEMLFLYTDGVTEACNRDGDLFRVQRLVDIAERAAAKSPRELMLAVTDSVESFSAGTVQADDITCLVIRRNPAALPARQQESLPSLELQAEK
jgi:hypothetical protein